MIKYANLILKHTSINPSSVLEIGSRDAEDANFLRNFFRISSNKIFVVEPNPAQHNLISSKFPFF